MGIISPVFNQINDETQPSHGGCAFLSSLLPWSLNFWHIWLVNSRFRLNIRKNFFCERVVKHGTGFPGNGGVTILGSVSELSRPGISPYGLVGMVALGGRLDLSNLNNSMIVFISVALRPFCWHKTPAQREQFLYILYICFKKSTLLCTKVSREQQIDLHKAQEFTEKNKQTETFALHLGLLHWYFLFYLLIPVLNNRRGKKGGRKAVQKLMKCFVLLLLHLFFLSAYKNKKRKTQSTKRSRPLYTLSFGKYSISCMQSQAKPNF